MSARWSSSCGMSDEPASAPAEPAGPRVQLGYFPNGPSGSGSVGLYVDTLPGALLAAPACLILLTLFSYVLVLTAGPHAAVARARLRPPEDPLARAKDLFQRPGPLPYSFRPNERWYQPRP